MCTELCISGRIDTHSSEGGTYWSYNSSNFYPADVSGKEYNDASHVPLYRISDHNAMTVQVFLIAYSDHALQNVRMIRVRSKSAQTKVYQESFLKIANLIWLLLVTKHWQRTADSKLVQ